MAKPLGGVGLRRRRATAQDAAVCSRPSDELELAQEPAALTDDPERRKEIAETGENPQHRTSPDGIKRVLSVGVMGVVGQTCQTLRGNC